MKASRLRVGDSENCSNWVISPAHEEGVVEGRHSVDAHVRVGHSATIMLMASLLLIPQIVRPESASVFYLCAVLVLGFARFRGGPLRWPREVIVLGLLIPIGLVGSLSNQFEDVVRDVWYFGTVPMVLMCGWLIGQLMHDLRTLLKTVVWVSVIGSMIHVSLITLDPTILREHYTVIRETVSSGEMLPIVGLAIVLGDYRYSAGIVNTSLARIFVLILNLASIFLSFSRTLWALSILATLVPIKGMKISSAIALMVLFVFVYVCGLTLIDEERVMGSEASERSFFGKLSRSGSELSFRDYYSTSELYSNYRGFETVRALVTFRDSSLPEQAFGHGFGARLSLGGVVWLSGTTYDSVPVLHNGYALILIKTGILGMALFMLFLGFLVKKSLRYLRAETSGIMLGGLLLIVIASIIILSSFVIAGLFNKGGLYAVTIVLGSVLGACELSSVNTKQGTNI